MQKFLFIALIFLTKDIVTNVLQSPEGRREEATGQVLSQGCTILGLCEFLLLPGRLRVTLHFAPSLQTSPLYSEEVFTHTPVFRSTSAG